VRSVCGCCCCHGGWLHSELLLLWLPTMAAGSQALLPNAPQLHTAWHLPLLLLLLPC
jgi:hypothetical protein